MIVFKCYLSTAVHENDTTLTTEEQIGRSRSPYDALQPTTDEVDIYIISYYRHPNPQSQFRVPSETPNKVPNGNPRPKLFLPLPSVHPESAPYPIQIPMLTPYHHGITQPPEPPSYSSYRYDANTVSYRHNLPPLPQNRKNIL